MHRSGTSALTRVLSLLGADLPATLMSGTRANLDSNAKGHWESEAIVRLNDEIFDSAGISWRSPEGMPSKWYESVRYERFRNRAQAVLESEFGESALFAFKDPRVCKLVPFWLSVLEEAQVKPAIVTMVRNPEEVADSLLKRNALDRPLGMLMWLRYVLNSERDSRANTRVHLSYDKLLTDWQGSAERISNSFGFRWPSASVQRAEQINGFLSDSERHHQKPSNPNPRDQVSSWANECFKIFDGWVEHEERPGDIAKLDAIAKQLDDAVQPLLAPLLVSYEKSAAAQKLQTLRSNQTAEIDKLKSQFQAIHEQLVGVGAELEVPFTPIDEAMPEIDADVIARDLDHLAAGFTARREASAVELRNVAGQLERANAQLSALNNELTSKAAELASKEMQRSESAARAADEMAQLAARHEREKRDSRLRETKLHRLVDLEREQRLATEARLAQAQKINATLLIVRGRFEAASEEMAGLRADRDGAKKRAKQIQTQFEELEAQFKETQAKLEDLQKRSKSEREKLRESRDKLQAAVAAVREDRDRRLAERDSRIKELSRSVKRLERELEKRQQIAQARDAETGAASSSVPPARTAAAPSAFRSLIPGLERRRLRRNIELVESSGLFDPAYYLEHNEDLRGEPELLKHFILYGGAEGRAASAAFDSRAYLRRYPDVAAAGLNPLVHFLESGRDEGRTSVPVAAPELAPGPETEFVAASVPEGSQGSAAEQSESDEIQSADAAEREPSHDADQDGARQASGAAAETVDVAESGRFSQLATKGVDWLRAAELPEAEALRAGDIRIAVEAPSAGPHAIAALRWFDALNCGAAVDIADAGTALRNSLCDGQFTIDDAWLSSDFELRLRLSGNAPEPLVIRCCQQSDDGIVSLRAEQLLLGEASKIAEIALASRFTALLLVVTDREGRLVDSTLLPFPTLLRGGLHHGELIDYAKSEGGWAAHESYASELLLAFADQSRIFAVGDVCVDLDGANGTEPVFSDALRDWIDRQFKVGFAAKLGPTDHNPALAALADRLQTPGRPAEGNRSAGRTLLIDAHSIPTLRILLAREAELADVTAIRTILVDELSRRPMRAVDYPVLGSGNEFRQSFEPALSPAVSEGAATLVVSISFSPDEIHDVRAAFPIAGDSASPVPLLIDASSAPVSAIISCSGNAEALAELIASLGRQQLVSELECVLIGAVPDVADSALLPFDAACPLTLVRTGIEGEPIGRMLSAAVAQATHERLLLVDDNKVFHDPRTLGVLGSLCDRAEAGAAGCQLVTERLNKNSVAEYTRRSGYLPLSSDRNGAVATRPEAGGLALPPVYPVVAHPIGCLLTKRELWPVLGEVLNDAELDGKACDVAAGLALIEAGKLNLATSLVSVCESGETRSPDIEAAWLATMPRRFVALEEY
jgi:hypothetical protein